MHAKQCLLRGRCGDRARPDFALRATPGSLRLFTCVAAPRVAEGEAWWSQTGSNRRPHACKARALPAELWPRTRRRMLHVEVSTRSSVSPSSPVGLRRARFALLFAWLRHA